MGTEVGLIIDVCFAAWTFHRTTLHVTRYTFRDLCTRIQFNNKKYDVEQDEDRAFESIQF